LVIPVWNAQGIVLDMRQLQGGLLHGAATQRSRRWEGSVPLVAFGSSAASFRVLLLLLLLLA
jgi:hypothetical protein